MHIAIRCDATVTLGLGHLKRCLSLAHALRAAGAEVRFFWMPSEIDVSALVAAEGFSGTAMESGAESGEQADAAAFIAAARDGRPEAVIVDHYSLGATWHQVVRDELGGRVIAIADRADRALAPDLLVDHNFARDHQRKYAGLLPAGTPILGGPNYAMLGPAYAQAPRCQVSDTVASVGIFMGGTDAGNLSAMAHTACREGLGFAGGIEIATTRANPNLGALRQQVSGDSGASISLDQPDLAAFFARHGLQLGAGGGATWERCCIGAPTLALVVADNQRDVVWPLEELGVIKVVRRTPPTRERVEDGLKQLLTDAALRRSLSSAAQRLVDGLGASRIAARILTS